MVTFTPRLASLLTFALVFPWCSPSYAALFLEERFDGTGYTVGAQLLGLSGGSGFDGSWFNVDSNAGMPISAPLSFSDYPVSGNAVTIFVSSNSPAPVRNIGNTSMPLPGGELWTSYLYQHGSGFGSAQVAVLSSSFDQRFRVAAQGPGINGGVAVDSTLTAGSGSFLNGTFLLVAKFTNFGLGSVATPQTGAFWVLSPANYDAIKGGGITEAELNASNTSTAFESVTSPFSYDTTSHLLMSAASGAGLTVSFDEIRYATDLKSALSVVPEPSALALMGLASAGAVGILAIRRRAS